MECHQRLAEIPGHDQARFLLIAQQMARELERTTAEQSCEKGEPFHGYTVAPYTPFTPLNLIGSYA